MNVSRRIVLRFPKQLVDQPIIHSLSRNYNLVFNILKASVTPGEEGVLVFELTGNKNDYEAGIDYLKSLGVKVEPLSRDVKRNELKCTHCGVCVTVCPTGALSVDRKTMRVEFDSAKCTACELCVKACPPRAMEVHF
ncbi:MAG: (Fe-S)-binding protein [Candidatus Latescibacterota bacterium]|nr:MAG: (Fe-S)-binding protein [Candidatus Latescibacterota bacterium]RKY70913.1 MAG: (Fe-S)-binding protein [Candidatus Latescibacterota bacterium]HDN67683.1 4Fe-4S dicluster domain-containing protein [Bacillota bacterium]